LKSVIQSYFEIRYSALSISQPYGFQLDGFGDLVSDGPETKAFLDAELGKLAIEIKRAELYHLKYIDYKYFLNFRNMSVDSPTQMATVSVIERNEVIYEISPKDSLGKPIVSHMGNLEHVIILRHEQDHWKIVSDNYNDSLWRALRESGKSTEEMINLMEASPSSATQSVSDKRATIYDLDDDTSTHEYDREGAVAYALRYGENPNPDYYDYSNDGGDCTNFVSQAIYEDGNTSMDIPYFEVPPPSWEGRNGWYYVGKLQHSYSWNGVDGFYSFVTDPSSSITEGPEGYVVNSINELMKGDVIQYERTGDDFFDHQVIVVGWDINGDPMVASHTENFDSISYTHFAPWNTLRFIHIERSDGYLPVKAEIEGNIFTGHATDDAGTNPGSCTFSSTDNEVYLGSCFDNGGDITGGFLFNNIEIPQGAYIKYAYLVFTVDGDYNVPIVTQIYGETNTTPFTFSESNPPESRLTTNNASLWVVTNQEVDYWNLRDRRTPPALTAIVREIVKSQNWNPGDSLSFIFKNTGSTNHRRVIAFDRTDTEPDLSPAKLIIAYSLDDPAPNRPVVESIIRASADPTNAATVRFNVKFSEPVTGLAELDDFTLTPVGVSDASISGGGGYSNSEYYIDVNTGNGSGALRLDVAENATIADLESNPLYGGFTNGQTYTIDKIAPSVRSVTLPSENPTNGASVYFMVAFSESVSGVDIGDFVPDTSISGTSVTEVNRVSGTTYLVSVNTGSGNGVLRLRVLADGTIVDTASNPLNGQYISDGYTSDKIAPTVLSGVLASTNPTNATSVNFTVTFPEPVTGVDTADFTLTTTGVSNTSISAVTGSSATYTVSVNTGNGSGTIRLDVVDNDSILDYATNPLNGGFTTGQSYTVDRNTPTVSSVSRASANPTNAASVDFNVAFPENVTGVEINDFTLTTTGISGAAVSGVSGSNNNYTLTVNTGNGSIRLDVLVNASIFDQAGNPLTGLPYVSGETYTVNKTPTTPGIATLVSPNGNIGSTYNPTYIWNEVPGATWYYLYVNGPSGDAFDQWYSSTEAACNDTSCSVTPGTILVAGTYTWWVQTWNTVGYGPWSTGMSFTISLPAAATLVSPSGDIGSNYTPTYTWNAVSSVTYYQLTIQGPSGTILDQWYGDSTICSAGVCTVTPPVTLGSSNHTWWVRTWNPAGYGPWSTGLSFSTIPLAAATLVSPTGTISSHTPTYTWNQVSGATWYYLWVNGPSGTVINQWYDAAIICSGGICSITPSTTLASGAHTWWIQTWNPAGYGLWSSAANFTVSP
jgi:hypothetical protein